jgi:hypothetical protein
MKNKANIPRPLGIIPHEILIALRPLLLRITRKHTLQTDTHTLDVVNRRPTGTVEQIEADDAVGVDVRVPGYGVRGCTDEDYFGGLRYHMALVVFLVVDGAKRMWCKRIMEGVKRSEWGMGGGEQVV